MKRHGCSPSKNRWGDEVARGQLNLQDAFLNQLRRDNVPLTVFLVNGVQIKGYVRAFDNFTVMIESDNRNMLIYKHALSTLAPSLPVNINLQDSPRYRPTGLPY